MNSIIIQNYDCNAGLLILGDFEGKLCLCDWKFRKMREQIDDRITSFLNAKMKQGNSPLIDRAVKELNEYFSNKRADFSIPILLCGTDFQKKVWESLMKIPYGKTISYLNLSKNLGDEKAIRAVASANGANAISIIVPCHRVVGSKGELTGYAGGLAAKRKLLKLEGSLSQGSLFDE